MNSSEEIRATPPEHFRVGVVQSNGRRRPVSRWFSERAKAEKYLLHARSRYAGRELVVISYESRGGKVVRE